MQKAIVLLPVYNDWDAFLILMPEINRVAGDHALKIRIMAVNDGSLQIPDMAPQLKGLTHITQIDLLHLSRNLGHQRAIAVGVAAIANLNVDLPVIVMDCDGEDDPNHIPRLLAEHQEFPDAIIFARRAKRSEGIWFLLAYLFYKLVFRILTGRTISFGNFCLIPPLNLRRVAYLQEIWNHFAAGIMHSGMRWRTIPAIRGRRFAGESRMNLVSLVVHGLSAISVYIEIVYVRLMILALMVIALDIVGVIVLVYIKYFTPLAIPGWATSLAIGLVVIILLAVLFLAMLSFIILSYRSMKMFIPAIDFKDYLHDVERLV